MELVKLFGIIISLGTFLLTILMLPVYFIRRKKNPYNPKNSIIRLIVYSFVAVTTFTLLLGLGLIAMYIDDIECSD